MKIIVKDGIGRPYKDNEWDGDNVSVWCGEPYPAFAADGKTPLSDGEYEAKLVWQSNTYDNNDFTFNHNGDLAWDSRQVYVIKEPITYKTVEELAEEWGKSQTGFIFDKKEGFIAGHTAATSGMVKKDEVVEVFKWLLGHYDFPEPPKDGRPKYYWRSHLREKLKEIGIEIENPYPFSPQEKGNLHS